MLEPEEYLGASLGTFLDAVASGEPTPGGGAVCALCVAMAAALVRMAASFSEGVFGDADVVGLEAESIRAAVAKLVADDAIAYTAVLAAMQLDRNDPDRRRAMAEALGAAADVPLRVAEAGERVNALARQLVDAGNRNLRGDALTAAHLSAAATKSAAVLVAFNLSDEHDARVQSARALASRCSTPD
ncbi:MAG: cyclodeaminase/cyclohydrolase family protein [Acidimicrobiales bacterium]